MEEAIRTSARTPEDFVWKSEKGVVTRYKARLVARLHTTYGLNHEETYSPIMDATTFRLLLGISSQLDLEMRLMDVVTAYLYGHLGKEVYIKVSDGIFEQVKKEFRIPRSNSNGHFMDSNKPATYGISDSRHSSPREAL